MILFLLPLWICPGWPRRRVRFEHPHLGQESVVLFCQCIRRGVGGLRELGDLALCFLLLYVGPLRWLPVPAPCRLPFGRGPFSLDRWHVPNVSRRLGGRGDLVGYLGSQRFGGLCRLAPGVRSRGCPLVARRPACGLMVGAILLRAQSVDETSR